MLFVTIIQFVAVSFTITALVKNTLMLSPEQHGVTCNITSPYVPKQNITAEHLMVYWGWTSLQIRWDFEGLTDTQIWIKETYKKTYDLRCNGHNYTILPTPAPILISDYTPQPSTNTNTNSNISDDSSNDENAELLSYDIGLPMQNSIYYPFKTTQIYSDYYDDYDLINYDGNNETNNDGCDDLEIVIETGKSYFSLLICGLTFECIALILLISPTCLLQCVQRRLLKQIVIGLNTVSFMLLLMAFAIWFAYFSTNINQVIEKNGGKNFSVCILGSPVFGDSIAYVLSGWLLLGIATMSVCYLGNRPKRWYRFLRQKRLTPLLQNKYNRLNKNINRIEEESSSEERSSSGDSCSEEENEFETHRLGTLINRTPNSSGSNDTYMTADGSLLTKGDMYPSGSYSPN